MWCITRYFTMPATYTTQKPKAEFNLTRFLTWPSLIGATLNLKSLTHDSFLSHAQTVQLSEGQLLYLPSVWEFPHLSKTQVLPANEAPHTPPSGRYAGSDNVNNPSPPKYLDSYFPAAMQLLHYYSERMQYAEHQSTTVAPPYTGGDYEVAGITPGGMKPQMTSTTSATTSTTAKSNKLCS